MMPAPRHDPLFALWFGNSELGVLTFIAFAVGNPDVAITINAIGNVPTHFWQYARSLGSQSLRTYARVVFPAAFPQLRGGLLLAVAFSWSAALAAEFPRTAGGPRPCPAERSLLRVDRCRGIDRACGGRVRCHHLPRSEQVAGVADTVGRVAEGLPRSDQGFPLRSGPGRMLKNGELVGPSSADVAFCHRPSGQRGGSQHSPGHRSGYRSER